MVMATLQIRLGYGLVKQIDSLIKKGIYENRSEAIRDAVRRLVLNRMIGLIQNTGDSVKEIREIRKQLSKEKFNLEEINKLAD